MRFKFVFSAEWPSLPQCLALCLNIIFHSFIHSVLQSHSLPQGGGFKAFRRTWPRDFYTNIKKKNFCNDVRYVGSAPERLFVTTYGT